MTRARKLVAPDCGSAAPTLASLSRNVKATPADRR
jgi:hypothetical protein